MKHLFLILAIFLLTAPAAAASAKISNTNELIAAMQKRYGTSWYKTATFVQETTNIQPDGTSKVEIWYEAMSVPGSLRIDFTPTKDGNGILFTDSKIFVFKNGKVDSSRAFDHPLLILGFDIYRAPAAEVTTKLAAMKFDLSQFREDTWQGRPVYVVGAKTGDLHSPQFWIDQENLYFVRMLRPAGKDGTQTSETQFNKYQKLGGGWIAPEVIFMIDGKIVTTEKYSEIRADVTFDPKLFDPQFWTTVHWKESSPSPQPKTITAADLTKLRWIEGSWKGTGDIDKPFYERYRFENETTLLVESFEDEKFDKVTEASRFELKDGHFGSSKGNSGSVAIELDDNSITFAPLGKMRNFFRFQRESADSWKAILTWKAADGTPKERVYKMDRVPGK